MPGKERMAQVDGGHPPGARDRKDLIERQDGGGPAHAAQERCGTREALPRHRVGLWANVCKRVTA
jgi:hypothetical protein